VKECAEESEILTVWISHPYQPWEAGIVSSAVADKDTSLSRKLKEF